MDVLEPDGGIVHSPSRGDAHTFTMRAGGKEAPGAAWRYEDSPIEELRDLIRLDWGAMGAWFEEDEEVFTHPRDPYTRVDILPSTRHVGVEVDGVTVAESTSPRMLSETGLPVHYYLPKTDVRMDLLTPTDTATQCPYRGQAEYWSIRAVDDVHPDRAWSYLTPCRRARRSPASSPSTTRPSTSSSTASSRSGRSRSSAGSSSGAGDEHPCCLSRDAPRAHRRAPLADDAVRQWPQSGELIDDRARIAEVEAHFAGLRRNVGRRHAVGDTVVVEWSTDYGDGRVYGNVTIAELRNGEAIRVTDYWGEPFTPPEWRAALARRLEMPPVRGLIGSSCARLYSRSRSF